jgi:hypothetical protein
MNGIVRSKLAAEKRIELVHVSLMREKSFAFFAGLFMVGSTTVTDQQDNSGHERQGRCVW